MSISTQTIIATNDQVKALFRAINASQHGDDLTFDFILLPDTDILSLTLPKDLNLIECIADSTADNENGTQWFISDDMMTFWYDAINNQDKDGNNQEEYGLIINISTTDISVFECLHTFRHWFCNEKVTLNGYGFEY